MPILTTNEAVGDFTHVVKLNFQDLQAIGTGLNKKLITLPAGSAIDLVGLINTVDIVGSSTLSVEIGVAGATTELIAATDVDAMTVMLPVFNTGTLLAQVAGTTTTLAGAKPAKAVSANTDIVIKVTDAALASITAGEIVIGFRVINLGRFA
jgi:hypothetical protein